MTLSLLDIHLPMDECLSDFLALFGPHLMQPVGEDLGLGVAHEEV